MIELIVEWGSPRDLETAKRQADAAVLIGATWSKWQIYDPKKLASADAQRYWDSELGGSESQLKTFEGGGLSSREWLQLGNHCRKLDVKMLATPFDLAAVDLLESIGVEAYKLASGDVTYRPLYEKVAHTGKRIFFSTGAASIAEIRSARAWLKKAAPTAMACDLVYPCRADQADLTQQLKQLRGEGITSVLGYSDHTREIVTGAVAVAHGARVLEKHVTLDTDGDSPDDRMALTVEQAGEYLRLAESALDLCKPVKDDPQREARQGARRSAYAAQAITAGQVLIDADVAWLRPAPPGSIPPTYKLKGRVPVRAIGKGERITRDVLV